MNPAQVAAALSIGLFVGIVVCLEVGYRLGRRSFENPGFTHEGVGTIEAAVFALLGLLLGFSFAGGTSRLDTRRQLIIEEANAIGTAYLLLDTLAAHNQPEMRRFFREYLEEAPCVPETGSRRRRPGSWARGPNTAEDLVPGSDRNPGRSRPDANRGQAPVAGPQSDD